MKICDSTSEALFLHLKYVIVNGYYFNNGYDNIKYKNFGHYEDGDDFLMFCMQELTRIMKQQSYPNGAPCLTSKL